MNFLTDLVTFRASDVFNPWGEWDYYDFQRSPFAGAMRTRRLISHFSCNPRFLLIGEAPGYQGCRYSGVAFTSERLILAGAIPRVSTGGVRITRMTEPLSEPSATIVWGALHELNIAHEVVMFNAFPFHPHKPGEPHTNRTPTVAELKACAPILRGVLNHFSGVPVLALGRKAEWVLDRLNVKPAAVLRHPSMGGANQFRAGIRKFVEGAKIAC